MIPELPPPRPRKITHGAPTPSHKRVVATMAKASVETPLGIAFDHEDCEMVQRRAVIIGYVEPGGLADGAGIKRWDVVHSLNGHTVLSPNGLKELLHRARFRKSIELVVLRPPPRRPIVRARGAISIAAAAAALALACDESSLDDALVGETADGGSSTLLNDFLKLCLWAFAIL